MTASQISLTTTPAVALWTSGVVPNNWGPPFSTGWQQHASFFHAEWSHLDASLSRFWLGLNLKRVIFLGGREGICMYSVQTACVPRWSVLTMLRDSRQSYRQDVLASFQCSMNSRLTLLFCYPLHRNSSGWEKERFCFSEVETEMTDEIFITTTFIFLSGFEMMVNILNKNTAWIFNYSASNTLQSWIIYIRNNQSFINNKIAAISAVFYVPHSQHGSRDDVSL